MTRHLPGLQSDARLDSAHVLSTPEWAALPPPPPVKEQEAAQEGKSVKIWVLTALCPETVACPPHGSHFAFFFLSPLLLTQHLGLRSRVIHWLMNSLPVAGYWNAQPSTKFKAHITAEPCPPPAGRGHHMMSLPPSRSLQKQSHCTQPEPG